MKQLLLYYLITFTCYIQESNSSKLSNYTAVLFLELRYYTVNWIHLAT